MVFEKEHLAGFGVDFEKVLELCRIKFQNPARTTGIAAQFYYNKFKDHYQLIRGMAGAKAGENYHDLDVYGGGLNANVAWALGKTAVGFSSPY